MENLSLLVFDPGITTGYATLFNGKLIEFGHLKNMLAVANKINEELTKPYLPVIIVEAFKRANAMMKEQIQTVEMVGAIKALALINKLSCVPHWPEDRTAFIPIAKLMLKAQGYKIVENKHAIDAIAHGVCYMDFVGYNYNKQEWLKGI
jgi:7-cyano-7-deazaguanine synthase in queuosine biosynthesis